MSATPAQIHAAKHRIKTERIYIPATDGTHSMMAQTLDGLAVHQTPGRPGTFSLTHHHSGFQVASFSSQYDAVLGMRAIITLTDWTKPKEDVLREFNDPYVYGLLRHRIKLHYGVI
jgi:hypothetical protein